MIDRINPFIKLVTVLVTSLLLMFSPDWRLNTFIIVIVLLLLFTSKRVQLRKALKSFFQLLSYHVLSSLPDGSLVILAVLTLVYLRNQHVLLWKMLHF